MMEWTRDPPTEPGEYWICEEHWCDGEPLHVRIFRDLDEVLMCQAIGWLDPVKLTSMPWPSYWARLEPPSPPVFA